MIKHKAIHRTWNKVAKQYEDKFMAIVIDLLKNETHPIIVASKNL